MSSRSGYNSAALTALICGTLVACTALIKGYELVEVVALVGLFTTIAGTVLGRGEKA